MVQQDQWNRAFLTKSKFEKWPTSKRVIAWAESTETSTSGEGGGGGGEGRNEFCAVGGYSEKNVSIDGKGGYLVSYKSKNDKELVREQ